MERNVASDVAGGQAGLAMVERELARERRAKVTAVLVSIIVVVVFVTTAAFGIPGLNTLARDKLSPSSLREYSAGLVQDRVPDVMKQAEELAREQYVVALDALLEQGKERIPDLREHLEGRIDALVDEMTDKIGEQLNAAVDQAVSDCKEYLAELPPEVTTDNATVRGQLVQDFRGALEEILVEEVDPSVARFVAICQDVEGKLLELRDKDASQLTPQERLQKELLVLWIHLSRTQPGPAEAT